MLLIVLSMLGMTLGMTGWVLVVRDERRDAAVEFARTFSQPVIKTLSSTLEEFESITDVLPAPTIQDGVVVAPVPSDETEKVPVAFARTVRAIGTQPVVRVRSRPHSVIMPFASVPRASSERPAVSDAESDAEREHTAVDRQVTLPRPGANDRLRS